MKCCGESDVIDIEQLTVRLKENHLPLQTPGGRFLGA